MPVPPDPLFPETAEGDAAPAHVRYRCRHITRYSYTVPVAASQLIAHLGPRQDARQRGRVLDMTVEPAPAVAVDRQDWLGNAVTYVAIDTPHLDLTVSVDLDVAVLPRPTPDLAASPAWEDVAAQAPALLDVAEFLESSPRLRLPSPDLAAFAADSFPPGRPVGLGAHDLMSRIHADFTFDADATTVSTPVLEVLDLKRGVCQDFAHLMIGALRALGLPARYVSGYLRTLPPPGQPRLQGADASHAWAQVWCGAAAGWVDMDPTNDTLAGVNHITLAYGRDYNDVSPLSGVILGGDAHALYVSVDVEEQGEEEPPVADSGQSQSQSQSQEMV